MLVTELIQQYAEGKRNFSGIALATFSLDYLNLSGINLAKACLVHSNFRESNLSRANLVQADLTDSCLHLTNLTRTDLTKAILIGADLAGTDFTNANLQGTCLDPQAPVPETDLSCFETEGDYVIGYRTQKSIHNGNTIYEPGKHYIAPYFSVCTKTKCHPGIYLDSLTWVEWKYPHYSYVKVKALKAETLKAEDKYRAKQIWVLKDV